MCGIAGIAALDPRRAPDPGPIEPMLRCIEHRGPDDRGVHAAEGVVLGHRRLSVIDPAGGHQPLHGRTERTAIVANGEVYNYRELREELEARGDRVFRSASDSEVAAHAYDAWGLDFLDRLDGMFALAVWDAERRRLVLARDRMGEKPLYWAISEGLLLFASELRSVLAHPAAPRGIDLVSLSQYLALEYVPAPRSTIRGVQKLEPATALVLEDGRVRTIRYWSPPAGPRREGPVPSFRAAASALRGRLEEAVRSRLVSDVPLGVFLSGGIDSSTVAALAARRGPVDTFSIGFDEPSFDESAHARAVARHIGSRHHERVLRAAEMPELVPRLGTVLDEPIGDASIVPTRLLCAFARETVTVALGGDGGDELFAGYPMHAVQPLASLARRVPGTVRSAIAGAIRRLPVSHRNFSPGFKASTFMRGAGERPPLNHVLWMSSFSPAEQQALLTPEVLEQVDPADTAFAPVNAAWELSAGAPLLLRAMHLDATTYLPNDILTKVDRAGMSVALEVRAPFLARDVVQFALALPAGYHMRGLRGKRLLRAAVADLLPPSILRRPKKGFGIPVGAWLTGSLRPLLTDVLSTDAVAAAGLFRAVAVERLVREHLNGRADHRKPLWTLLVFELWRRSLQSHA